jgi:hypothetical protein
VNIYQEYRVTPEQVDSCTRYVDEATNVVFYLIPSATTVGTFYRAAWNKNFARFSCECKANQSGMNCWHVRAALVAARLYADAKRDEAEAAARIAQEQEQAAMQERVNSARPYRPARRLVEKACKRNEPKGFSLLR